MTPQQLARYAEVAYDQRDREGLLRCLQLLANGPDLQGFSRAQLLERRVDLFAAQADVNDRLAAMDGAGRVTARIAPLLHELPPPDTLDPSDPEAP